MADLNDRIGAYRLVRRLGEVLERAHHARQGVRGGLEGDVRAEERRQHGGRRDKLEISPNLWAGVGLMRHGVGTALVGSPETVAARLREYQTLGVQTIIASGYPHLEEAYRFAELVFPLLPLGHAASAPDGRVNTGPFGEIIANDAAPLHRHASQS